MEIAAAVCAVFEEETHFTHRPPEWQVGELLKDGGKRAAQHQHKCQESSLHSTPEVFKVTSSLSKLKSKKL